MLNTKQIREADDEARLMANGLPHLFPSNFQPFDKRSSTQYKCVVWMRMTSVGALPFLLEQLSTPNLSNEVKKAYTGIANYMRDIYYMVSDASFDSDETTRYFKEKKREKQTHERTQRGTMCETYVHLRIHCASSKYMCAHPGVEVLCELEAHLPHQVLKPLLHAVMHFPKQVHRWNNVHNTWCFFMERYMAHIKGFVHNAKEPAETLVRRISYEKVMQGIPVSIRQKVSKRCARIGSSTRGLLNIVHACTYVAYIYTRT